MSLTLMYCCGDRMQSIADPCIEDIIWTLNDLIPAMYHFAILDDAEHANGNIYLQTRMVTVENGIKLGYVVETRFFPANKESNDDFTHYQMITEEKNQVLQCFKQYFMGKPIDVTDWKDITETFKNEAVN